MSEEQARQRAQELTKKALAEAENETFKIDRSLQGKHIVTKSEKAAKKKEEKRIENEMRRSSDKPAFLVLIAGIFDWSIVMTVPVTHFIGTVSSTDITSGLSAGTSGVTGFSGKCYCARISGHTYVAHLDGVAYLGTVAVAKTGFNTVSWRP